MMLMPGSCYSAAIVILSWITGTLSQPAVKRASAIALINAVCNTPNSKFFCGLFPNKYTDRSSLDIVHLLRRTSLPRCVSAKHGHGRASHCLCICIAHVSSPRERQIGPWRGSGKAWPYCCPAGCWIPVLDLIIASDLVYEATIEWCLDRYIAVLRTIEILMNDRHDYYFIILLQLCLPLRPNAIICKIYRY